MNITVAGSLDPEAIVAVTALLGRVTDHDGMPPLSEHVWLHMREGGDDQGLHLLAAGDDGCLIGYAHLDVTDEVEGASAELAVDPEHRRHGVGRALMAHLVELTPDGRMRLWAHGDQTGAAELAASMGFIRSRVLWQMRRSLFATLPKAALPAGVEVRPFRVGQDEEAWLRLNARAFVQLPDQASWTRTDLERRIREPWFSPEGFLMAWRGSDLVGFHWTKVHGHDRGQHQMLGEVYVVAVDPAERGTGLGRDLTLLGLHHLRALGLSQAMLYVDAANTPAIRLYEGLGFSRWDTDTLFQRSIVGPSRGDQPD